MLSGLFQPMHLIVILVIVLIIVGPGKLPQLGTDLAKGIKSFKRGIAELKDEENATPVKHEANKTPIEHKEEKTP